MRNTSSNAETLRALPVARIVRAIADAAERWVDADFPPRVRATAAIERRLGYTTAVVDYALDALFESITHDALEAAIVRDLGSLAALDGFVERHGLQAFARGVDRVVIAASDATIGVAIPAALFALCAKAEVLVKDREDELTAAFFATLAEEEPLLRSARATAWTGGSAGDAAYRDADVVVAYGGDEAIAAIRAACGPATRFVGFGHRASIGVVRREETAQEGFLDGAARDFVLYDARGCLSLHALYVERAGARDPDELAAALAAAVDRARVEFPPAALSAERLAAIAGARNLAAFRAATGRGRVYSNDDDLFTVLTEPASRVPAFVPRVLPVIAVDDLADAFAALHEAEVPLEAVATVSPEIGNLSDHIVRSGAVRITRFGELQRPSLAGHHGGSPRIGDFVRWIDRE